MFDLDVIEKQLMTLVQDLASSRQISKMLLDHDFKDKSLSSYVETQDGKNSMELHLKYVTVTNQQIAFISELLKKINALKPPMEVPAEVPETVQ